MAGETTTAVFGKNGDEVVVPVHGLDGTEAEQRQAALLDDLTDKARQSGLGLARFGCEVAAPAAEIDAGEDEFTASGGDEVTHLGKDARGGEAARGAARLRNHAEGAAVAAALLDFEIGARLRAGMDGRFFEEGVGETVIHQHLRCDRCGLRPIDLDELWRGWRREQVECDGWRERLVAIADDGSDAGQSGKFVGRALGIATGDDDARAGIAAMGAADIGTSGAVGFGGDGAGVDEDEIGVRWQSVTVARHGESGANGLSIGTSGAASEVFNVKRHGAAPSAGAVRGK